MASRCVRGRLPAGAGGRGRPLARGQRAPTPRGPPWWPRAPAVTWTGRACWPRTRGSSTRLELWRSVPGRLDGHGATAGALARQLLESAEAALRPLRERHARPSWPRSTPRRRRWASAGSPGRKELAERQHREERRWRTDELRTGLGVLARTYRDRLAGAAASDGPGTAESALGCEAAIVTRQRGGGLAPAQPQRDAAARGAPDPAGSGRGVRRGPAGAGLPGRERRVYDWHAPAKGRPAGAVGAVGGPFRLGSSAGRAAHS